jgi:DNA-binding IclR family transcriptional regulator
MTSRSITTLGQLRKELRRTRVQGYGVVLDEYTDGGTAVGAVIQAERAGVVGAVSLAAPSFRVTRETVAEFGAEVVQLAGRLASMWTLSGVGAMSPHPAPQAPPGAVAAAPGARRTRR